MNKMEIFRIETVAGGDGMWYKNSGVYDPRIFNVPNAKSKDLPMDYNKWRYFKDGRPLSCGVSDFDMLEVWFTREDRQALYAMGYGIFSFESSEFVVEPTQVLFAKDLCERKFIPFF